MFARREGTNRVSTRPLPIYAQYAGARLKGDRNMNEDQGKRFADKSARMTRESLVERRRGGGGDGKEH